MEGEADRAAFRRLFDEAYRPLLAYALRRGETPADAEEIVAETLLVVWRRRAELPRDDPIPWLYGVARRVLANQRRGRRRRRRLERVLAPLARGAAGPEQATEVAEAARALVTASRRLSDGDQEVLRLAVWEGLSHRDIAVALGCSENAAALRLHRAREHLRAELLKEDGLPGQDVIEVTR